MHPDLAVSVQGLSKSYVLRRATDAPITASEAILARVAHPFRRTAFETFDALHDVSFEVPWGQVVGVIGRNGAGKSTLLKILTRITAPTRGRIELGGRIGSLLEIGTGFHPELSGRENVYLNGTLLGMRRVEIQRRFDEIVAFAGVERFLETPVKRYSTGMYVRLAFAVAAHLEAEIMAVDEVLAVGDADFQRKCTDKMRDVARDGRTVFFVSHQAQTVSDLCDTALFLDGGRLTFSGDVEAALDRYRLAHRSTRPGRDDPERRPGSGELRIRDVRAGNDLYRPEEEKTVTIELPASSELAGTYWVRCVVTDEAQAVVAQCDSRVQGFVLDAGEPHVVRLRLRSPWLKPGTYAVNTTIERASDRIDVWDHSTHFDVLPEPPYPVAASSEATDRGIVFADFAFERC